MAYEKHLLEEERLQIAATRWLRDVWGYDEEFSDSEATGTRMDSAGMLDGRLVLIEVKPVIRGGMADFTPERSGSLESKVAGALGPMYRREPDRFSESANARWDRQKPAVVAFLASRSYEAGATQLGAMLRRRSAEWLFDWRSWEWDGDRIVERARFDHEFTPEPSAYATCDIPDLKNTSRRPRNRTLEELTELAVRQGVMEMFDVVLQHARPHGYRFQRQRGGLGLLRNVPGFERPQALLTFYLDASSADWGLKVGYRAPQLLGHAYVDVADDALPGTPAKRVFAAEARFLSNPSEVKRFLEIFAPG